jgi:hypothetical protein
MENVSAANLSLKIHQLAVGFLREGTAAIGNWRTGLIFIKEIIISFFFLVIIP